MKVILSDIARTRFDVYTGPKNQRGANRPQATRIGNKGNLPMRMNTALPVGLTFIPQRLKAGDVLVAGKNHHNFAWPYTVANKNTMYQKA